MMYMRNKEVVAGSQHGFTKPNKSGGLPWWGYSGWWDEGRLTNVICLDLCKVFDTVPHGILVSQPERHGFDGCIKNRLDVCTQRVWVNSLMSK